MNFRLWLSLAALGFGFMPRMVWAENLTEIQAQADQGDAVAQDNLGVLSGQSGEEPRDKLRKI